MTRDRRRLRTAGFLGMMVLALAACGGGDDGGSSGGDDTEAPADASGNSSDTTGDGQGSSEIGFDNGKLSFEISGDYKAKDDLPFVYKESAGVPVLSSWTGSGGWVAFFTKGGTSDAVVQMSTQPEQQVLSYVDPNATFTGSKDNGCSIKLSKNDSDGFKGSFDCNDVPAIFTDGKTGKVDYKGSFEGHK